MRKTKIICTLGPSTKEDSVLRQLMLEGMNVARVNFSHGNHEQHAQTMARIRKLRTELDLPIAILLDTKGPEIRTGDFEKGRVELKKDQTFTLTTRDGVLGDETMVSITYKDLPKDVNVGSRILIDDGLIEMRVLSVTDTDIVCKVINGGAVSNHKGINVPNVVLSLPYISDKDRADIVFGIEQEVDFIAASFVRSADDVKQIRKILEEHNCKPIKIISKIENRQGVDNIDEILQVSDGIMVARGDMGVEIPFEDVPAIQKLIIKKVYNAEKIVITATQMLDSMMKNPRPTRAEATDVATAIYDGTSAIMLSGETAAGMYPIEALRTMVRIAEKTEENINYRQLFQHRESLVNPDVTNAISHATCTTAMDLNAAAIVTVTISGQTARMISKYRPNCPIIGCSPLDYVCRQMNLSWGVVPMKIQEMFNTDDLFEHAVDTAQKAGYVKQGELVVITAGVPLGIAGTTNLVKVHVVGRILMQGIGVVPKETKASMCVCQSGEDLKQNFKRGDIIVISDTDNTMIEQLKHCAGIVVENNNPNCHAAIVGLSLDIPVIIGAAGATKVLKTGAFVSLDGKNGCVSVAANEHRGEVQ